MVETLISLFILSLGVIGAAAMQLAALRTTQQSGFQTAAVELAAELADSMRTHPAAKLGGSANPFLKIDYSAQRDGEPAMPDKLCYGTRSVCNHDELALFDIYELEKRLKLALPEGRLRVCKDAFPWDDGTSAYKWECTEPSSGAAAIVIKLGWMSRNAEDRAEHTSGNDFRPSVVLTVMPSAA